VNFLCAAANETGRAAQSVAKISKIPAGHLVCRRTLFLPIQAARKPRFAIRGTSGPRNAAC
jgi:hypothetical protein